MIQEKPYAYIKKVSPTSPTDFDVYLISELPSDQKIVSWKDNVHTGTTPPPPEEHSLTAIIVSDGSTPSGFAITSAQTQITQAPGQTYLRIYLVSDTPQGMGATVGTLGTRFQDSD